MTTNLITNFRKMAFSIYGVKGILIHKSNDVITNLFFYNLNPNFFSMQKKSIFFIFFCTLRKKNSLIISCFCILLKFAILQQQHHQIFSMSYETNEDTNDNNEGDNAK